MDYKKLELLVLGWAKDKGILDKATPIAQCEKTDEEVNELMEALYFQNNNLQMFRNKKGVMCNTSHEIKDALGDVLVTIIIQAELQNVSLIDCLESAYDVISKRTGKMVECKFVKDK